MSARVCVELPVGLSLLAKAPRDVWLEVEGVVSQASILDALELRYPALRGTVRDQRTKKRRAFIRFFACLQDLSHMPAEAPVPEAVAAGREKFLIVGAIAGG